jgi:IPT/TIG domain-containing protein
VLEGLVANLSHGTSGTLREVVLAAAPSPSPSTVSSDSASALPNWLLITLAALVAFVVLAMFALTAYNLSAPRAPLNRLLKKNNPQDAALISSLATNARVGTRTTRTTLAIAGFSLLGVAVIAVFGLSGQGVRDLRSQVVAAITTLVAAIAGFYFGTRAAQGPAGGGPANGTAATPTVTGVSPASGSAAGGDTVTVTGTGLTGASGVSFGTVAASNLAVASDTQLTVTSPSAAAGTVDVTVTTPAGTSAITPADQFTYN